MLTVSGLRFYYDDHLLFDSISLSAAAGSITALIGANGAGKSTLMNCITGVLRPFSGDIRVDGLSLEDNVNEVRRRVGYLPDNFGLFSALSARQHLEYVAAAHGIRRADAVEEVAARADLIKLLPKTPDALSRGERQRLGIAMVLIHKPRFILLDEPASGLDPAARLALSALLQSLRDNGATLLVSSHILSELRDYASDYIIMDKGRILSSGSLAADDQWRVALRGGGDAAAAQALLSGLPDVSGAAARDGAIYFQLAAGGDSSAILRALVEASLPVSEFTRIGSDIEKIYQDIAAGAEDGQSRAVSAAAAE